MTAPKSSVVARVSLASLVSAGVAAALAAVVACAFAEVLLVRATDRSLQAAATELAHDLSLPAARPVEDLIREEEDEGASLGMRFAVVGEAGEHRGGDPHLARGTAGCATVDGLRVCTVAGAGARVTAGTRSESRLPLFALAAVAAAALAALVAWVLGGALARRALAPLVRLEARISALRVGTVPAVAENADLGPEEGVHEVDELRSAVLVLHRRMVDALAHSARFSSNAAHELRTPLATLRAELELLGEAGASDDVENPTIRAEAVARASTKVRQLQRLTEHLLVLATPAVREDARELVSLREVVEEVVLDLPPNDAARITIDGGEDVLVRGDSTALAIVVSNGVSNALKFGARVCVEVSYQGDDAVFAVEDDGPGVAAEERELVFEPFARGRHRGAAPGSGIGLSLVAHVAERHAGSVALAASRRWSTGARLEVRIPRAHAEA